jgi:hypothetical protein
MINYKNHKKVYREKFVMMNEGLYKKMTKKELLNCMADLSDCLRSGTQEYCTPYGDAWTVEDEILRQINIFKHLNYGKTVLNSMPVFLVDRDENGNPIDNGILWRKKEWLVEYVVVLDMAYMSMNEILFKHRYHDCCVR